jgi:hypothetical protein
MACGEQLNVRADLHIVPDRDAYSSPASIRSRMDRSSLGITAKLPVAAGSGLSGLVTGSV